MLTRADNNPAEKEQPPPTPPAERAVLPRVSVVESVRRHKLLTALPVVVLAAAAIAWAYVQTPTYTANSYQQIGRIDLNTPGALSGFQSATETLATSYARAIYASAVVGDVARRTGLTVGEVRSRLGAYTVPQSAVFVVGATGSSEEDAVNLSIVGTRALRSYIEDLNVENPNSDRLFRDFRAASLEHARLSDRFERAARAAGANPAPAERDSLERLEADVAAAELRRDVARVNYGDSQRSQSTVSLVQDLALADTAEDDRFEDLQLALFIAVSVGVLLGLALATAVANRDVRRALSVS